ncbi:hypothetical protein J1614_008541 [Plenodomus biglobosus]|nr:hypothetical protein J1614_008541 [Plenodomus biglobosus]
MSTRGQFNTKNPTIKRILKEASELSMAPAADYHAEPLEENLFEWHFTIRGPPEPSAYAGGIYHGRIILPPQYPLRPPSFRFLTPTGRFEVNREICLSISGHHEETWQPAWGVRTALVAIRSFMDTDAKGQLGGIECSKEARERMARDSGAWRCGGCGKSNAEIMKEREALVADMADKEGAPRADDAVPEELRLAYRDELDRKEHSSAASTAAAGSAEAKAKAAAATGSSGESAGVSSSSSSSSSSLPAAIPAPARSTPSDLTSSPRLTSATPAAPQPRRARAAQPLAHTQQVIQRSPESSMAWIDTCIYGLLAALVLMVVKKFG